MHLLIIYLLISTGCAVGEKIIEHPRADIAVAKDVYHLAMDLEAVFGVSINVDKLKEHHPHVAAWWQRIHEGEQTAHRFVQWLCEHHIIHPDDCQ